MSADIYKPHGYKSFFSCSTQLSMKFQLLIKAKMVKKNLALILSDVVVILLMLKAKPIGILTYMGRINFMFS